MPRDTCNVCASDQVQDAMPSKRGAFSNTVLHFVGNAVPFRLARNLAVGAKKLMVMRSPLAEKVAALALIGVMVVNVRVTVVVTALRSGNPGRFRPLL